MKRMLMCAVALAMAWGTPGAARAEDPDLAKLREEVKQLRQSYESRIQSLEKRLQAAEAKSGQAEESAASAESSAAQAAAQASSRPQAENALNPAVSAILNGTYANLQQNPDTYRINGFVPTLGEVSPGKRGVSLGESELGLSANIDPWFRGTLIASIAPDNSSIEVEEGYIQTLALSSGFTIKAGRFFSAIGYQNQVHAHAWDFTDAPLAMKAFLGNQLAEDGLQVKWVAPTALYWDLGVELGRGRAFPATDRNKNGFGSSNLFSHLGGDIGESLAWQAGLSYYRTRPNDRQYTEFDAAGGSLVTNSFTGKSDLWVADGVLKWSPQGNPTYNNFKLQGEYFRRRENGQFTYNVDPGGAPAAATPGPATDAYRSRQSGWYAQGAYQFLPAWRVGYRFDRLNAGTTTLGLIDTGTIAPSDVPILGAYSPKRHTLMFDWSPSEFSRIRLQLARDYSRMGLPDNQIFLQYIVSMGAHGAHKF
jgi:hypothetical protein